MKRILILLTAFYLALSACTNKNNTTTSNSPYPPIDTLKNATIDTMMYHVAKQWKSGPNFHTIKLTDRNSIDYLEVNGEPARISAMFYSDTIMTWITAYQFKQELTNMRFRQWQAKPQPNVQESISYFENGKIYYSRERNKILGPNEQMGSFRTEPFKENFRNPEELMAEYMPFWEITKKAIANEKTNTKQ